MRKLYLCTSLCAILNTYAQEILWQQDIKSSNQAFLSQITTTVDQQYLITGSTIQANKLQNSQGKQNNGYDFHLVKLNQQGGKIWEKYFSGRNHDYLSATVATQEGGFLLAGTSYSDKGIDKKDDSKGGSDIWLIRINEFGDQIWQETIGSRFDEQARSVIQNKDLGFFVGGNTHNNSKGYSSKDVLIIRLDKNGKELSQIIIGGKGSDEVEKIIPTKDGGALLGIYSRSNIGGIKKTENYGEGDYWIIKLSNEGKIEWEKNLGGSGDDHLRTLALTATGFLVGGESRSEISGNKSVGIEEGTDIWLLSLNEKGEEIWQKSYNFKNRDVLMGMNVVHSSDDKVSKGILLGGYTQREDKTEVGDETFWIMYLDQNGKEEWRKHIKDGSRKNEERLADLKLNRDGSIILAGTSAEELGKENWKIIKLGDKQIDQLIEKLDIKIYPNPVSDYCYVEIGLDFKEADIKVYDIAGRQLQSLKTKNKITKINTQSLIQGAYLIVIHTDAGKTLNSKLIKK